MMIRTSSTRGFTLIEMLVVLVILGLTTSLMTQGLSTTWNNFSRLGARDLMNSYAQLPASWFEQSLQGAVLYHPYEVQVSGSENSFKYVTFNAPNDNKHIPQDITWSIHSTNLKWYLAFTTTASKTPTIIRDFTTQPKFEYWSNQQWQPSFEPPDGRLPIAVRIIYEEKVWTMAKIGRPEEADMPAELPMYGEYEF
jgi:general secretion pathway protein J